MNPEPPPLPIMPTVLEPPYGLRVLVIEDDPDARANLREILELDDHRVEESASAAEALARRDWPGIAAIILDRKLPDALADDLLPRLRQAAPEAAVLIVTGYADLHGAISALRQGATDYILKPIVPDDLRARLRRVAACHRTQSELRRAERLAAIGQVVAGLAHESRNALQRSQACLEMLALKVADQPEALDLIARLQTAQDHLQHLFEDVRGYAAPIRLERRPCDVAEVWREAWRHLEPQRKGRQAVLRELATTVDLVCQADPFRLERVFGNVLENALGACADPVLITVSATAALLGDQPAICVAIRDNGPGIDPEDHPRIFEPFFTTRTRGTGLGLAISRRIVRAHGGRIAIGTPAAGTGAELQITLPRG